MITKSIRWVIIAGSLALTALTCNAILGLGRGNFPLLTRVMLVGVVAVYTYGAISFMTTKGINLLARTR